ncbi:hypothetical protein GGI25_006035 [Coemansia spiralis]|uniref:Uncharacterized protein n=2 Tax=Coemansia TaxID=4863 RepID=A0A9W8FXM0_9FUNG|nr:hypothetical protein EDC05_006089 [Coemansia umbellata]KAJ2618924.1 hypothetical protein GGI26_006240 [Coemansia sp. RSA 1358]KAJ2669825.1 hypothetical protein GGI25_006035 [Coemansia spiralis]
MGTSFPLDKPSWSVATLLKKPDDALRQQKLKGYLSNAEVQHLYTLSGLKLPDPTKDAEDFERVLADVNKLRDFLSHIQVASASEDLDSVEPLVRICEPVVFTTEKRDGDLSYSSDPNSHIGEKVLDTANQKSGPYLVVEA